MRRLFMRKFPRINLSWRGVLIILLFYALFLGGFALGTFLAQPHTVAAVISPEIVSAPDESGLLVLADKDRKANKTPRAVVYCTHTSEEYAGQIRQSGVAGGVLDAARTLASCLEDQGVETILLDDIFDAPDWNNAYTNSLNALEKIKAEYPDIEIYIDVHRDSQIPGLNTVLTSDSKSYARLMFIVGSNANLPHPNWQKNLAFTNKVDKEVEDIMPGLVVSLKTYNGRYNQHIADKAFLVEIGSNANTTEQAKASAAILAEAISNII